MRALVFPAALLLLAVVSPSSPRAQDFEQKSEQLRAIEDLKHYHGMVAVYRQGNDEVVADILTWDEKRLGRTIGGIDSKQDPNRPWGDDFLRSAALLQTAAALDRLDNNDRQRMRLHFDLAAQQLRLGSAPLAAFASRWYYAISRLLRSRDGLTAAEQLLEGARMHLPGDPLVLYESATIEEMRATEWQSARITPRGGSGSSFRDANALDDILKDRASRLQNARDWLRQSVAAAPMALSRLHFGRVLMMGKDDDDALQQLARVRGESPDRAVRYLAMLFTAAVYERQGRLDDAARVYQESIECFPESDVAYVGLSEVLQAAGQGDRARAVLREFLSPRAERHEPWSWYFLEPRSVARDRIVALFDGGRR